MALLGLLFFIISLLIADVSFLISFGLVSGSFVPALFFFFLLGPGPLLPSQPGPGPPPAQYGPPNLPDWPSLGLLPVHPGLLHFPSQPSLLHMHALFSILHCFIQVEEGAWLPCNPRLGQATDFVVSPPHWGHSSRHP